MEGLPLNYIPPDFIPPLELGEVSVEFEPVATSRSGRNGKPCPLSATATAMREVLYIDNIAVVYVSGNEIDTVCIVPQDRKADDGRETCRFTFDEPIVALVNLKREMPRIGVVLADGSVHLLLRMRMMPWVLGDAIKPAIPPFHCDTLSVSYLIELNSLLWLFQRRDPKPSPRSRHRQKSYELWMNQFDSLFQDLIRGGGSDFLLTEGLPGPGRMLPLDDHLLVFFNDGVLAFDNLDLLFRPLLTEGSANTKPIPCPQLWQPSKRNVQHAPLNLLQLHPDYERPYRGVFHEKEQNFALAIFGDVLYKFTPNQVDLVCEAICYLTQLSVPLARSPLPLNFVYARSDVVILHDGTCLCVFYRQPHRKGKYGYTSFYRDIPGVLVPSDNSSAALFRRVVGPPVFVNVVPSYMVKIPQFLQQAYQGQQQYRMRNR